MNGCGTKIGNESFSIRSKYMVATNSICIYIHLGVEHLEWWMDELINDNIIIKCKTVDEAIQKITHFENNPKEAEAHLKKQMAFSEKYLMKEIKDQYWIELLKVYTERSDLKIYKEIKSELLINETDIDTILDQNPPN